MVFILYMLQATLYVILQLTRTVRSFVRSFIATYDNRYPSQLIVFPTPVRHRVV